VDVESPTDQTAIAIAVALAPSRGNL
jgi:hypothetical protein